MNETMIKDFFLKKLISLPSALAMELGKEFFLFFFKKLCRVPGLGHSAK
jgi:hypothetical protein